MVDYYKLDKALDKIKEIIGTEIHYITRGYYSSKYCDINELHY